MEIALIWLALSVLAGVVASSKGRSGFGYFMLSVVLSPLIGLLAAALMSARGGAAADNRERIPCPQCAEMVIDAAVACPHCGYGVAAHLEQARLQRVDDYKRQEAAKRWRR